MLALETEYYPRRVLLSLCHQLTSDNCGLPARNTEKQRADIVHDCPTSQSPDSIELSSEKVS